METMMQGGKKMCGKRRLSAWAAGAVLTLASGAAMAQYTPGAGNYVPPQPYPGPQPVQQPQYNPPPQPQAYGQPAEPYGQPQIVQVQPPSLPQAAPQVPLLSDGQLGDLTASVALYPDPLLAQMLPAATYVQELAFADKWLAQHPGPNDVA